MGGFILLMAALMAMVAISIDAMLPALGIMADDLGVLYPNQVQYIIGILFAGMALGQLIYGPLSDAIGRKKVLYIGLTIYGFGSVLGYQAQTLSDMLIGRFIQGLGVASPYISAMAIVRDKYVGRDMARIMSLVMVIFILVPCIAPLLGQGIITIAGWRDIFLLYLGLVAVMLTYIVLKLEETLRPEDRIPFSVGNVLRGFQTVLSNRHTVGYTACMGIVFGSFMSYLNSAQQIFQEQFLTGSLFTLYFSGLAFIFGISSFVNARIVKRLGMRHICFRGMIAIIVASTVFVGLHFLLSITLWMFLIYAAILFFVCGLMFGNLNSLAMEPMGHIAGLAAAIIGCLSTLISMTIGATIGQLYNGTLIPLSVGYVITGSLGLIIMIWADRGKLNALV